MQQLNNRKSKMKAAVAAFEHGRQLVIELHPDRPGELLIREAGRRLGYWCPFRAIYTTGARLKAIETAKARAEQRKARGLARIPKVRGRKVV